MSTQPARITRLKQVKSSEKADTSGQLTPKQEEFVQFYFTKNYIVDAAEAMNISDRTARRYLKLPAVIARLEEVRQDRREAVREQLNTCMEYAVEIIKEKLTHGFPAILAHFFQAGYDRWQFEIAPGGAFRD